MYDVRMKKARIGTEEIPESVVIVQRPRGWVAHIRYKDNQILDEDVATAAKWMLLAWIDRHFE